MQQDFQRTPKKKKRKKKRALLSQAYYSRKTQDPDKEASEKAKIFETVPMHKPAKGYNTITYV